MKLTTEHKKKLSEVMQKNWQDPKWRAAMIAKQEAKGWRYYQSQKKTTS